MKKAQGIKLVISISLIVGICFVIFGAIQFNKDAKANGQKASAAQTKYIEELSAQKEKEEAEAKAEAKRIIDSHKGQQLVYSPMGDSIAEGYLVGDKEKYVSLLTDLIEKNLGYDVKLEPIAVKSGTGIKDNGLPNVDKVIEESPDFVTIEFGTNDMNETLDAYSEPDEFEDNLSKLIGKLQDSNKEMKILLVTTWKSGNESLQYDKIIEKVGEDKKVPVANIQPTWKGRSDTVTEKFKEVSDGIKSDGWHPNVLGHELIANKIYGKTYDLLK